VCTFISSSMRETSWSVLIDCLENFGVGVIEFEVGLESFGPPTLLLTRCLYKSTKTPS
jgi:hypothetical protein